MASEASRMLKQSSVIWPGLMDAIVELEKELEARQREISSLTRERDEALAKVERMDAANPEYCFDPNNWEWTHIWDDRDSIPYEAELSVGHKMKVCTFVKGPDKWAAHVPVTFDDDGNPLDTEIQWFDTEEEAARAARKEPKP